MEKKEKFEFKNILNLHIKYVDYLISKTYLSHQDIKNIALSGSETEAEIRFLFQNIIPDRFRVTHGYILHAPDNVSEPKLSKQVDFIIVDNLVTNRIFSLDKNNGMEIVPVESVVGIFEVKRTLNEDILGKALEHLKSIIDTVGINKADPIHYLPGGIPLDGLTSGTHSNPLIGIISLDHDIPNNQTTAQKLFIEANKLKLDFITSLSGLMICPVDTPKDNLPVNFLIKNIRDNPDEYYCFLNENNVKQTTVLSRLFGYVSAYLANCTGKKINARNYFFNKRTWELIEEQVKK